MSGHSKWSSIKHKKAAVDAKRGKIFTKIIREITVAARTGGDDVGSNPRLRTAIQAAKSVNMPGDNMERAIKKGTGELPGTTYEEISYEGYGVAGAAVMVEVMTDNKNRTVAEIRSIFTKAGGSLGENGCVAWMFDKKGLIIVPKEAMGEDEIMDLALEAGADDFEAEGDEYEIKTDPSDFDDVRAALEEKGVAMESAEVTMVPQNTVTLSESEAKKMIKLMDALDDQDDVQKVYSNFDIPDEVMESLSP
jgi:YebC/PmpR family DNA-binding regulatory protein